MANLAAVPSQTFTHRATTRAPIEDVWTALDRPGTWEAVGGVDRVFDPDLDEQGRLRGFSFETVAGGRRYVGTATPQERVEGERMSWRITNSEVRGLTVVDLAPTDEGTAINVTLEVESAGLLSSLFFGLIATAIGSGLPESVNAFAAGLSGSTNLR